VTYTSREPYFAETLAAPATGHAWLWDRKMQRMQVQVSPLWSRDDTSSNSIQTPLACYEARSPISNGKERRRSAGRLA
jgi:hypothetical protein